MPLPVEEGKSVKYFHHWKKRDPKRRVFLSFSYPETPREGFWSGMAGPVDTPHRYWFSHHSFTPRQQDFYALRRDYLVIALGFLRASKRLDGELGGSGSEQKISEQEQLFDPKELGQSR